MDTSSTNCNSKVSRGYALQSRSDPDFSPKRLDLAKTCPRRFGCCCHLSSSSSILHNVLSKLCPALFDLQASSTNRCATAFSKRIEQPILCWPSLAPADADLDMYTSLGALPPRNRHSFQDLPGSAPSSQTTCPDPMFGTRSISSQSSTSNYTTTTTTTYDLDDTIHEYKSGNAYRHNASATASPPPPSADSAASDSRFDSLHELLERAGYKETRVVTPDRQTLAGMLTKKLATPPRKPRLVDDFSSDSPSLAASELRKVVQKSAASRSTPKASTSKSLPSRNLKLADTSSAPPLPAAPTPSSSWFSNIWFYGPGTIFNDTTAPAEPGDSTKTISISATPQQNDSFDAPTASTSTPNAASTSSATRAAPPQPKRTATNNTVWSASVAYRSQKSRTAPVRKKAGATAATSSDVLNSDEAAEASWQALQKGSGSRRPGLVDAFSSPTKKTAKSNTPDLNGSPDRQRKWKKERAAWRESLGDLQAMMDQSRLRREAAAAAAAAEAEAQSTTKEASISDNDKAPSSDPVSEPDSRSSTDEAVVKLLSGPALPFLSTDPAVAPRNGSCTRPTHLSMRRMKSVEVLSKIIRERRTISTASSHTPNADATQDSISVDTESGQISPTIKKRSTPPRLTVSSPRGISSPKELALEGQEFEPISWSPGKAGGAIIISNRRVQKKPKSKLRQVSSGSDLRSAATAEQGLKMPKRGRTKQRTSSPNTSPSKVGERGPIAALLRESVGSLSKGSKAQALRSNVRVFDDAEVKHEDAGGVDDSPTRMRSRGRRTEEPLILTSNRTSSEVDDIFRPSGAGVLKKKDFSAKITRTSKIMRLIEEAENIPSIASMISQPPSNNARGPLREREAAPQPIATAGRRYDQQEGGLSSSLSKKSRDRMHTITRVLGQRQPN